jgi:hypothetical protein
VTNQNKYFERFLINVASLLLFLVLYSCDKDEIEKEDIKRSFEIKIDNENLKVTNSSISSNESCNGVFASCRYDSSNNMGFRIEFRLNKNGALRNITLFDYRNKNMHFETADFNPKGLMTITNFEYDETKNYLHFNFKGELLEQSYSDALDVDKKRKHIEGTITIQDVRNTECTSFISDLNFETNTLNFLTNLPYSSFDSSLKTNPYQFFFYSDNGYRALIKSKKDLWDLDKGTYTFDQNSPENRVDLEQYVGIFRATQLLWLRPIDWKKFQTAGSYTIKEHVIINGLKVTKGEINMQVYNNGVLLHTINNGAFEATGFK